MKFNDYYNYRDYYVDVEDEWLGCAGGYDYYYKAEDNEVVRIRTEEHRGWQTIPADVFVGKRAELLKKAWDDDDEDKYENVDELQDALDYAENFIDNSEC